MTAAMPPVDGHDYLVFGLRVRSALALPELFAASGSGEPDVVIETGAIDAPAGENGLTQAGDALLLTVEEVGRFLISAGRTILVEPVPGIDPRNIRLFLLGSAFGAVLHQRGLLPLHANAVEVSGRAFAFMGESGAGKSTLAAWFHDRGFLVLADDVCVVRFDSDGRPRACPGLPRLRLWLDAIQLTGRETEGLNRSYVGGGAQLDKFDLPVDRAAMHHGDVPLGAVYLLDHGDEFGIIRLEGVDAARAIFENTYRGAYVAAASNHRPHWESAVALARNTPVFRIARTMTVDKLEAESQALLGHVTDLP